MTIRDPIEWGADPARLTAQIARTAVPDETRESSVTELAVRHITLGHATWHLYRKVV